MKILIVDDHVLFRQGLVSLFNDVPDFEVSGQVGTVSEAISLARQTQPDMVLLDYGLPDGKGPAAAKVILSENPECKIVYLTMHMNDEELFAAIRSGAKGYLLKTTSITTLLENLRAVQNGQSAMSPMMTSRILTEFARLGAGQGKKQEALGSLTPRELEVLHEIALGSTNQEIAENLFMAKNTVKRHVHSIFRKLNVPNRHSAAKIAREHGLG